MRRYEYWSDIKIKEEALKHRSRREFAKFGNINKQKK